MSIQVVPTPLLIGLSEANPGELVIWNGAFALVCNDPLDELKRLSLAVLKSEAFEYEHFASYPQVITLGSDLLIHPTIDTAIAPTQLGHGSGTSLFIHHESAYVVLTIPSSKEWRVLELSSGSITVDRAAEYIAIPRWRLGIPDHKGERVWVLSF